MANRYGLSQLDENLLSSAVQTNSNFGLVSDDYAKVYVYDESGESLEDTFIVPSEKFIIEGGVLDIDIGKQLRANGLTDGTYKVIYYFYRPVAGNPNTIFLESDNTISEKQIESNLVNGKLYYFHVNDAGVMTTVTPSRLDYYISKIAPSSTEITVTLQEIDNEDYRDDFISITDPSRYFPMKSVNAGVKFGGEKDDPTITLDLTDQVEDGGFQSSMIGGKLVIPNAFTVLVAKTPDMADVSNYFDKFIDGDTARHNPESNEIHYSTQFLSEEQTDANGNEQPESPYTDVDGTVYKWTTSTSDPNKQSDNNGYLPNSNEPFYYWKAEDFTASGMAGSTKELRDFNSTVVAINNPNSLKTAHTWDMYRRVLESSGARVQNSYNPTRTYNTAYVEHITANISDLNTYFVLGDASYLVTAAFRDEDSISLKLYAPLLNVSEGESGYFVQEVISPIEETIKVIPFKEDFELNSSVFLAIPNIEGEDNPIDLRGTNFKSYDNLVGSNTTVIEELENKLVSGSLLDVKLSIDYSKRTTEIYNDDDTGFGNFVNFSSAEERVRNFKYKFDLIETYTSESGVYSPVSSSTDMQNFYDTKVREVKNSFDDYEYYLYHNSSSYASSSVGQFHDTSWPKENSSTPYILAPTTSSVATTWFNTMISSASLYDTNNQNRLVNNLPGHVKYDDESKVFLDFMDMVGQQFDETWIYLKHFTDMNDRQNKLSEGISKDIVKHVAKASGLQVYSGNDLLNLSEYLLGKDIDDASQKFEKAQEEVTEEIWKRILANLPYFQRTKGTIRALKGLLNCYGIPSSILRVREYGGPDYDNRITYDISRKFTYALDFRNSEYVNHLWTTDNVSGIVPETVEFRFRSPKRQNQTIVQKGNQWAISLQDGGTTNKGYLRFAVSASTGAQYITSSLQQFYNDEMWSVMLTRKLTTGVDLTADTTSQNITYELVTKQYDATRFKINYQTSASLVSGTDSAGIALNAAFISSAQLFIGGSGSAFDGNNLSGSVMEYRLWSEPLSQSKFDNHVRTPKSYNGNTTSSHYNNLIYRNTFDENQDLSLTSSVSNSADVLSYSSTGSAVGYSANLYRSISEIEQMKIPDIGASRRSSNKVRIESNYLTGSLSRQTTLQKSSFDFAPVDSNRLGIYFSPTDVIDKDIIYSLADVNYDDYIGDPRDQFEYSYRGLDEVRNSYWQKYKQINNFWDYLRILQYYDSGIFKQMKALLPARANSTLGVLVEPNILNRSKVVMGKSPEFESLYFENAGEFEKGIAPFATSSTVDSVISIGGEYPYYEGDVNAHHYEPESGSIGTLGTATLYKLNTIQNNEHQSIYATASITKGDIQSVYEESINPYISASRMSEHNYTYEYYFTTQKDASNHPSFGVTPVHVGSNSSFSNHSHSLELSEYQTLAYDSTLFRAFYKGTVFGNDPTEPGYPPVELTITSPTRLVTKEPGESRLVDDSKLNPRDTGFQFGKDKNGNSGENG